MNNENLKKIIQGLPPPDQEAYNNISAYRQGYNDCVNVILEYIDWGEKNEQNNNTL